MSDDGNHLPEPLRVALDDAALAFESEFYATALRHRPDNLAALAELATAYTRLGRLTEGLALDRRLAELDPQNPVVHYNLACSLALVGECEKALDTLEHAVALGYEDADHLERDEDLGNVRTDERFVRLLARLRQRA
ncbi:MAG: hypothetical protein L6Q99_11255 [Planctomycetes bacterium]|nr:hypothetical protein [Planctomycetota bacterium]